MNFWEEKPIPLYGDNHVANAQATGDIQASKNKFVHLHYHFVREKVEEGMIEIFNVPTEDNLADILTKSVSKGVIDNLLNRFLGIEVDKRLQQTWKNDHITKFSVKGVLERKDVILELNTKHKGIPK